MTDVTWNPDTPFRSTPLETTPFETPAWPRGTLRWRAGHAAHRRTEWRTAAPALGVAALLAVLAGLVLGSAAHGLLLFAGLLAWAGARQLFVRHRWGGCTVAVIGPVVSIVDRQGRVRGAFDLTGVSAMEVRRGDPGAAHLSGLLTTVRVHERRNPPQDASIFPLHLDGAEDADALVDFLHAAARRRGVPFVSS